MKEKLRVAVVACFIFACTLVQAQLAVSPNPIQFGTLPEHSPSGAFYVYLSNTTLNAIDITAVTISGANSSDFAVATPTCLGVIPGNSYCATALTFTPSALGSRSATLSITVTGVTNPFTVPITGIGGNPIPQPTSLSPANIYVGSAATTVTINGAGFLTSSLAYFGNSQLPLATTYVSATQLKVVLPSSDLSNVGQQQILVTNPAPAGGTGGINLQIVGLEPALNNVLPSSVLAGTNPGPIVLNGNNFMSGAKVQWNGTNVPTTYINPQQLQFQPTVAELATAGIVELSVTNPSPGTISTPILFNVNSPATVTVLDLPANDLVWDPFAQVIYASLPSSYGVNGNSVAVINPTTGAVTGYHFVGSEPTRMALSAGSTYLYVGLNGSGSIQRTTLPAFSKSGTINLSTSTSINVALDLQGSPTDAHTIAAIVGNTNCCGFSSVAFFTDSTKLANSLSNVPATQLIFPTSSTLYAYQNATLSQIAVTATGGTLSTQWQNVVQGQSVSLAAGLIYSSAGQSFNPATGLLLGTYNVGSPCCNSTEVLANSALSRVFALGNTPFSGGFGITSYNLTQFTPSAVANLSELAPQFSGNILTANLIQWGSNGVAFTVQSGCCGTTATQVVLVQSPTLLLTSTASLTPLPVLTSLSRTTATHGSANFILTIHGSNFVPGSTVTWNGKSVFASYQSSTQLRAYVPKANIAAAGTIPVVVNNPKPGGGKSNVLTFVVQ